MNPVRLASLALLWAGPALAQGPGIQVGRLFTDPPAVTYRLDLPAHLFGPVDFGPHALVADGTRPLGNLWGVGFDLALFRSGSPGFYAIGGLEGGLVTEGSHTVWGSWSAGLGYEVFPFGGVSLGLEGRYRQVGPGRFGGVELGARLGLNSGRRGRSGGGDAGTRLATAAPAPTPEPDTATIRRELDRSGVPQSGAERIAAVVQTALDVMGMPYRWGDEGEEGFDCSGLIQYAYASQGISLPRRSVDQAREGTAVERRLDQLRAGDILTFRTNGRGVSHVGLYVGDGRFIHSATGGVQLSILSPDDVAGRWWYVRWVGARRIIG